MRLIEVITSFCISGYNDLPLAANSETRWSNSGIEAELAYEELLEEPFDPPVVKDWRSLIACLMVD